MEIPPFVSFGFSIPEISREYNDNGKISAGGMKNLPELKEKSVQILDKCDTI